MTTKLFRNAHIFTPLDPGHPLSGKDQGQILEIKNGALLSRNGQVHLVGEESLVLNRLSGNHPDQEIDCDQYCMIPGFVDPHTHMCFARLREAEFDLRIKGTPYLEILEKGGGILSSVAAVRETDEDHLYHQTKKHVENALGFGTTAVEIKSGYGLDTKSELKMLNAIDRVAKHVAADIVPTFLGAHAVPEDYRERPGAFVDLVVDEMLPAVKQQGIARFCDVFCETGVFTVAQGRRILKAAQAMGLGVKSHADEVNDLGGAGLAAELGAISADHLLAAGNGNLKQMAGAGVVANLLPATAYSLRKPYARARDMIDMGLPVALATDCNPGSSYTESIPFVIGLAVMNMAMTPAEALVAATINGAYSMGTAKWIGSLDPGKQADFLLLDGDSPAILAYHAGVSPVKKVFKRGECIMGR